MSKEPHQIKPPRDLTEAQARLAELMKNRYRGYKKKAELMSRYYPEVYEHWAHMSLATHVNQDRGGLTFRQHELIVLAMEICMRHRDVEGHTIVAMRTGATSQQIAAVVGICMAMHGLYSFDERGSRALKTALDFENDPKGTIKWFDEFRGGDEANMQPWDTPY